MKNVGVATIPLVSCRKCSASHDAMHAAAAYVAKKTKHEALSDYAIKVLFMLGFLSVGDGGTEAERFLSLCDLPAYTSMEKQTFSHIEQTIAPVLVEMQTEILFNNLQGEVLRSNEHHTDCVFDDWLKAVCNED